MPKRKAQSSSDYRNLPAKTVAALSERAKRIRAALQRGLVEVGRELVEAKAVLSHGQFGAWVEAECGMKVRTAQLIMSAYKLCLKNENFSHLGRSALFALGAAEVPASTIAAVERQIAAGDVPRYVEVRSLMQRARVQRPSSVTLAIQMEQTPTKAPVVDLGVVRTLMAGEARKMGPWGSTQTAITEDAQRQEEAKDKLQDFRDRIDIADIAVMLNGVLDSAQVVRLVTMIRHAPAGATLAQLADALERI
jgi:hypothetical protein